MPLLMQQIRSYLHLRESIVRRIATGDLPANEVMQLTEISHSTFLHRRRQPDAWRIDEIEILATSLGSKSMIFKTMRNLLSHLHLLPDEVQFKIYKRARLDRSKLRVRRHNYNLWRVRELEQIAQALEHI